MNLLKIFKKKPEWVYGTCRDRNARKHRKNGNVQFVLWKAGEQGHTEDCWHDFHPHWWNLFQAKSKQFFPDGKDGKSDWWKRIEDKWHKDTGKTIDKNDPEYSAQKIYQHWIKSFSA